MRKIAALTLTLLCTLATAAEVFEGRSIPKPTKKEAILDAENDLGGRICKYLSVEMAASSDKWRSAIGSDGKYSSSYKYSDTVQAKCEVRWSGFKADLVKMDSSSKGYEAIVRSTFDRDRYVREKKERIAALTQLWQTIGGKFIVNFLESMPKFLDEYDKEASGSQPSEVMSEWHALSRSIDSTLQSQIQSVKLNWVRNELFDPCGRMRTVGTLSATSQGLPVKANWLKVALSHDRFKAKADGDAFSISYTGRCNTFDSLKVQVSVRGLGQIAAEQWIPLHANTIRLTIRESASEEETKILTKIGSKLMSSIGFQVVDSRDALFELVLDPKVDCSLPTMKDVRTCRARIGLKVFSSGGTYLTHTLESKGYGDTEESARSSAFRALDPAQ